LVDGGVTAAAGEQGARRPVTDVWFTLSFYIIRHPQKCRRNRQLRLTSLATGNGPGMSLQLTLDDLAAR